MDHSYALPFVCGVIMTRESIYDLYKNKKEMSQETQVYRDENGYLVSVSACNWNEAKRKVENNDIEFGRSTEGVNEYRTGISAIKSEWETIDSYCKHAFLKYPFSSKSIDGKVVKYVDDNATCPVKNGLVLRKNDFPYNLTSGVQHHVLWTVQSRSFATYKEFIQIKFPGNAYDVIMFENPKRNKSVKTVQHFHVFVRRKVKQLQTTLPLSSRI